MATLVCFHAHPDDESILTGGLIAKAAAAGHRVLLVLATSGEVGEPVDGVLDEGELLGDRRRLEAAEAGRVLGASEVIFLGYRDSGMAGESTNDDPSCFWQADVDQAADALAVILRENDVDLMTIYDDHGGYGHPDHIQVHRVGVEAAKRVGLAQLFVATINRDLVREFMANVPDDEGVADVETFGEPASELTHRLDVSDFVETKRNAMKVHQSQIGESSFFLEMPDEVFLGAFGTEWFIEVGGESSPGEPYASALLADGSL